MMLLKELEMFDRDFVEVLNCELIIEGEGEGKKRITIINIYSIKKYSGRRYPGM